MNPLCNLGDYCNRRAFFPQTRQPHSLICGHDATVLGLPTRNMAPPSLGRGLSVAERAAPRAFRCVASAGSLETSLFSSVPGQKCCKVGPPETALKHPLRHILDPFQTVKPKNLSLYRCPHAPSLLLPASHTHKPPTPPLFSFLAKATRWQRLTLQ